MSKKTDRLLTEIKEASKKSGQPYKMSDYAHAPIYVIPAKVRELAEAIDDMERHIKGQAEYIKQLTNKLVEMADTRPEVPGVHVISRAAMKRTDAQLCKCGYPIHERDSCQHCGW
jgi:hypothetical protein